MTLRLLQMLFLLQASSAIDLPAFYSLDAKIVHLFFQALKCSQEVNYIDSLQPFTVMRLKRDIQRHVSA